MSNLSKYEQKSAPNTAESEGNFSKWMQPIEKSWLCVTTNFTNFSYEYLKSVVAFTTQKHNSKSKTICCFTNFNESITNTANRSSEVRHETNEQVETNHVKFLSAHDLMNYLLENYS